MKLIDTRRILCYTESQYFILGLMIMRIEQLQYFVEVINAQSISAAAEKLYLQQSTLSHAIKSLESELGTTLLIRKNNGVSLSAAGEALFPTIERILRDYQFMVNYALNESPKNKSSLAIAVSSHLSNLFTQVIYQPLKECFPYTQIHIREDSPGNFFQLFKKRQIDIAFSCCKGTSVPAKKQLARNEELIFEELFTTTNSVICNRENPLAQNEYIHVNTLQGLPQLLTEGSLRRGILLTDTVKENLSKSGEVDIFPTYQAIFNVLCVNKTAYTILPTISIEYEPAFLSGLLVERPMILNEKTQAIAYVLYRQNCYDDVINTCIQLFKKLSR